MAAKTTAKTTTKRPSRRPPSSSAPPPPVSGPTPDEIAQRAFELFLARGGQHGRHEEDWLSAERELRARTAAL